MFSFKDFSSLIYSHINFSISKRFYKRRQGIYHGKKPKNMTTPAKKWQHHQRLKPMQFHPDKDPHYPQSLEKSKETIKLMKKKGLNKVDKNETISFEMGFVKPSLTLPEKETVIKSVGNERRVLRRKRKVKKEKPIIIPPSIIQCEIDHHILKNKFRNSFFKFSYRQKFIKKKASTCFKCSFNKRD